MFPPFQILITHAQNINPNLPGINAAQGPIGIITDFYFFALAASGVLAFGLIIYAALQMAIKSASGSAVADARDQITQALIGLALLLGAYFILYIINPGLTNLSLPTLDSLNVKDLGVDGEGNYFSGLGGNDPTSIAGGGSGKCIPVENQNSAATQNNLSGSCFGAAGAQASAIANAESGGNPFSKSGVDKCKGGQPFSIGLFQINLTQHKLGNLDCPSAFSGKNSNCTVANPKLYQDCVKAASDTNININKACEIYRQAGNKWSPWGANSKCRF